MITDKNRLKSAKPISGILKKIISSFGLTRNYNGWMVVSNWDEIVGKEIAEHTRATKFDEGCLYVAVDDAAWRQQLSMSLESILTKIQSLPYGGSVKKIRLTNL